MEIRTRLERYEILETLGKGGIGEVWKTRDMQLKYGVVLCEMLAGEFQFMGETLSEGLEADPPPWPSPLDQMQPQWRPIVKKSLAKKLQQRDQTTTDVIADLKQVREAAVVPPTGPATQVIERLPAVQVLLRVSYVTFYAGGELT